MISLLKPQIEYADLMKCVIGYPAIVYTVDHPNLTTKHKWRRTSPVVRITQHTPNGPVFETMNSIYKPAGTDETLPKATAQKVSA